MSIRATLIKVWQNGRTFYLWKQYKLGNLYQKQAEFLQKYNNILSRKGNPVVEQRSSLTPARTSGLQSHFETARRLFVDNVLRRVTNSLSADLRKKTTRQMLFGNSRPFFALVGVCLASGNGIINKEDELDGVCWEIREAVAKMQFSIVNAESDLFTKNEDVSLDKFELGPSIAKGSNAVIYAAKKKEDETEGPTFSLDKPIDIFPFVIKMMFNYDTESNATTILRAMKREIVPALINNIIFEDEKLFDGTKNCLPPHPNIVAMYYVFTDYVPSIPGSLTLYPDALPVRLNPDGSGRNMSLFLLMKRYDLNLQQYLTGKELDTKEAVLLFTQLLEGIAHINSHGIAHRDLKSDNILLEKDENNIENLVITDFGCCFIAESGNYAGLSMPFRTEDTFRGGNAALMAPEVALAKPGLFSAIDYAKSDIWAAGAIGYEIFMGNNPFYRNQDGVYLLRNTTYSDEDLPELGSNTPPLIQKLIKNILSRNPAKRLNSELAATVCQLHLWAPSSWLKCQEYAKLPSSSEILQWLLTLTTKVLVSKFELEQPVRTRTHAEYVLIASFLRRANLSTICYALSWIQSVQ